MIRIPLPSIGFKAKRATGLWGAFADLNDHFRCS